MKEMIPNIAVIGTGKRFLEYYKDILARLQSRRQIRIAGIFNRTSEKARYSADALHTRTFGSVDELLAQEDIDGVLNLVRGAAKYDFALRILRKGKNLYLETPAGTSSGRVRNLVDAAASCKCQVQIAEDFAFFPEAQVQAEILRTGILGPVQAVFNDEAGFAYHALARLHHLRGELPRAGSVWAMNPHGGKVTYPVFGVSFSDGSLFLQRFVEPKDNFSRRAGSWKVVCTDGVMTEREVFTRNTSGELCRHAILVEGTSTADGPDGCISKVSVTINNKIFSWSAPEETTGWSRKKQALSFLTEDFVRSILQEMPCVYGAGRAVTDIALWRVSKMMAKFPFPVRLPAGPLLAVERLFP